MESRNLKKFEIRIIKMEILYLNQIFNVASLTRLLNVTGTAGCMWSCMYCCTNYRKSNYMNFMCVYGPCLSRSLHGVIPSVANPSSLQD